MKTQAIIPTAGIGTRMNSSVPKPFIELKGKPLFLYCLEVLEECPSIDSIIIVGEAERILDLEKIVKQKKLKKIKRLVPGGARRCDSVCNGLKVIDQDTDCVLIHDSARPLITVDVVEKAIKVCESEKAVVVGVPIKPTIKRIDSSTMTINETLDRSEIWEVQTPQVFHADIILKAHEQDKSDNPTDDAALVEKLGVPVKMLEGSYQNLKVTTAEDVRIAEVFLDE